MSFRVIPLMLLAVRLLATPLCAAEAVRVVNTAPELVVLLHEHPDSASRADALAKSPSSYSDLYKEVIGVTNLQEQCRQYAPSLNAQLPGLTHLSDANAIALSLNSYVNSFKGKFAQFDSSELTIYLIPSFGRFQAQARVFRNKPVLLLDSAFFSLSMDGAIPAPFVHHELFHIYHGQLRPDVRNGAEAFFNTGQPPSLGVLLWVEGLAVHVARQLNPTATDAQLFPSASIVPATQSEFGTLVRDAADHADEATMPAISGFFYFPRMDHRPIPQNCGYVLGEKLIDQMLKERSLDQVMQLKDAELSSAIRRAADQAAHR